MPSSHALKAAASCAPRRSILVLWMGMVEKGDNDDDGTKVRLDVRMSLAACRASMRDRAWICMFLGAIMIRSMEMWLQGKPTRG